jgi:acetyl-CoA carboxylase biotin carboxyl carrier protein
MARGGRDRESGKDESRADALVGLVRQLGAALNDLGLADIEVSWADTRVRLQKSVPLAVAAPAPVLAAAAPAPAAGAAVERPAAADIAPGALVAIEAPMVGTFYRASSPTAEPYVREGDLVKQGQILCIIEAMKLMNEIESKVAGRVAKVFVENGQPVEYGQPLFLIDPSR